MTSSAAIRVLARSSGSRAFAGVSIATVERIRRIAEGKHGVVFDPHDGTKGVATARTPIGELVMRFAHDNTESVLLLSLVKKPMLLPAALVWSWLGNEVDRLKRIGAT